MRDAEARTINVTFSDTRDLLLTTTAKPTHIYKTLLKYCVSCISYSANYRLIILSATKRKWSNAADTNTNGMNHFKRYAIFSK